MKLSKKIDYHITAAENQGVDGLTVPKSRLYEWKGRAEANERRIEELEERAGEVRRITQKALDAYDKLPDHLRRPALGIQERTLAEAEVESEEQVQSPLRRGYLFFARAFRR